MKPYFLVLAASLLVSCGSYTSYSSNTYRNVGQLPANPDPDKCYVRCVTPDVYESYEESYSTYTAAEADEYPHRYQRIKVAPEIKRWEATAYEGCESDDPNACQVLCLRTYPAKYEDIYTPVDSTLGKPYTKVVVFKELVTQGGLAAYAEIDCALTSFNRLEVSFLPESASLSAEQHAAMNDQLLLLLREMPEIRVQINAHTDARGSAAQNQFLSERRAKSIVDYLVQRGINRYRLVTRGFGESQLKNHCADGVNCSEAEHALNERVEFRVVNMDL